MKTILAATALALSAALPAMAFDPAAMSETEKAAFGQAVRDYLMENPEVLVEAINEMEGKRLAQEADNDRALIQSNSDALFNDGHSWVGGNPDAPFTVVEFVDYKCGFCKQINPQVEDFIKSDGNIRMILKEFPILGQESDLAARFAISVKQLAGEDAYKKAHDLLMAERAPITNESLTRIADKLGVDAQAVLNHMNTKDVTGVIRTNRQLAERMAIMGTPTFIVGPEMLRGVPPQGFAQAVTAIRDEAGG